MVMNILTRFSTCSLPIQLLLCVNIVVNKHLTTSKIKRFYHIDISKVIFWKIISACNASYSYAYLGLQSGKNQHLYKTHYVIQITEIIVWTIIIACNTSYILPRVYNGFFLLPYRYTWDNKSMLLSYCSHAFIIIQLYLYNM